jgi:hypothetical protein
MPQNLHIAAFVFGAVLILISLVGGRFRIFGAEISDQVGKVGRTLAFLLGLVFILLPFGMPPPASEPKAVMPEPATEASARSAPTMPAADPAPVAVAQPPARSPLPPVVANIGGAWIADDGALIQVTQDANRFTFTSRRADGVVSWGQGVVKGNTLQTEYQSNIPSFGQGQARISTDGASIQGSYSDSALGNYTQNFQRP